MANKPGDESGFKAYELDGNDAFDFSGFNVHYMLPGDTRILNTDKAETDQPVKPGPNEIDFDKILRQMTSSPP